MNITEFTENNRWILEDLKKSGLKDEIIEEMKIEEIPNVTGIEKLKAKLGFASWNGENITRLTECYVIPYPVPSFCRIKLHRQLGEAKYLSPTKQTHNATHLYFLPSEKEHLSSPKYSLVITEGEKKTVKLTQEVRSLQPNIKATSAGLSGVTVWRECEEWNGIPLSGRDVFIVFDADFIENPSVAFELLKFWIWLWSKKANPKIVLFPLNEGKGIDDFLVAREQKGEKPSEILKRLLEEAKSNVFDIIKERLGEEKIASALAILSNREIKALFQKYEMKGLLGLEFDGLKGLVEEARKDKQSILKKTLGDKFTEKDGKTYKVVVTKDAKLAEIEVANFVMRVPCEIKDDGGQVSWECSLSKQDKTENFELSGKELLVITSFREKIASRGAFLYDIVSTQDHNAFIEFVLSKSQKKEEKRKTEYLGRIEKNTFLFNDTVVARDGIKSTENIIPPKGRLRLGEGRKAKESLLSSTVHLIEAIYPEQSWKIWGTAVGSLFVEEISEFFGFFPLLFLYGSPQSGKTTLARIIMALFGAHREINPFNFNATSKALQRSGAKYKGIPITLNEFQNTKNANALICSLYDREGYQRARMDSTLDLHKAEINATFMVLSTQSIQGHEAEAVLSRVVQVNMDSARKDMESIQKLHEVEEQLAFFVLHCLQKINPEKLMQEIMETIANNRKCIKNGVSERILENYSIIQACANVFCRSLGNEILEKYGVSVGQTMGDMVEQHKETIASNVAKLFTQVTLSMVRKGELPESIARISKSLDGGNETLIFSLTNALPFVRRFAKQADIAVVDDKTLIKNLKTIGAKNDREYWEGKQRNVWKVEIIEFEN